jgi:predicted transcriptional regulator of viral defense system
MKFIDFKHTFSQDPIIDIRNVITFYGKIDKRRLYEWQQKHYIEKLANNYYIFSGYQMDDDLLKRIANTIYSPSYIALESALSFYQLIPEAVFQLTSLSTRKTNNFHNHLGSFRYQTIHRSLFFGYTIKGKENSPYYISDPEKTILDYLYLNSHLKTEDDIESMRLNRDVFIQLINTSRLKKYLQLFKHQRLEQRLNKLARWLDVKF